MEKNLSFPVIHCGMALAFMVGTRAAVFAYESEVPPQDISEFEAIVGEWMEVGGMFFSVDSLGQMCFKEYGPDDECEDSNDSDFIFTALGNNRYQIEEDGDLVFLELDGDVVKLREDGYEEASAIFARFGSEELSKLVGQWVIRDLAWKKRVVMVEVLAPICVEQYRQDPNRLERFAELKKKSSYQRDDYVKEIGWATMPGAESPVRGIADACAKQIIKLAG